MPESLRLTRRRLASPVATSLRSSARLTASNLVMPLVCHTIASSLPLPPTISKALRSKALAILLPIGHTGYVTDELMTEPPAGFTWEVDPGWPALSAVFRQPVRVPPMERVRNIEVPAAFQMTIRSETGSWQVVLFFATIDGEITMPSALAIDIDVDQALDRVLAARPIGWWKTRCLFLLTFEAVNSELVEKTGKDFVAMTDEEIYAEDVRYLWDRLSQVGDVPTTRRRDRITDALLREVAEVYRNAWAEGENPTSAVAAHFFKSHSTAARWVGLARKAGYLGPSDGSRGGERAKND